MNTETPMIKPQDKALGRHIAFLFSCLLVLVFVPMLDAQTDHVDGRLIQFNDNGAWSWFEDERAIVDAEAGQLLVSSISDASGADGRNGHVDVATFNFASGRTSNFTLNSGMVADDHNSAALLKMNDGRYLAAYSNHLTDNRTRSRSSVNARDATSWNAETGRTNAGSTTYNNLFQLSGESNRIYNFTRTLNFDPNILVSDDNGASWQAAGNLINGGGSSIRPYVKYTSNDVDEIHFVNTENHPRNFDNSVYHAYMKGGKVFNSFGVEIDSSVDGTGIASNAGTQIFSGDADNVGWVSDIHLDNNGNPFVAFSVQKDSAGLGSGNAAAGQDHRYHYARFDGTSWQQNEIAFAGSRLYAGEDDYTGNIALNPNNPNEVYISTNADPTSGNALVSSADGQRHWEIYKGTTADNGQSFTWTAVTENSTVDNLRPIIPEWDSSNKAVLWMRGDYSTYLDYDLAVVGVVESSNIESNLVRYIDANGSNTTRTDGLAWDTTTGSGQGAVQDGLWRFRTGFGNDGSVLASDENGSEDVDALTTTVTNVDGDGMFDVFAYFWSNKNEDWEFQAGLDADELALFRKQAGQHVDESMFLNSIVATSDSGNEFLYQAYLGRVSLADGESLSIFIDDGRGNQDGVNRTWYDGVGLSLVTNAVPEPASGTLLVFAFAMVGLRRSRVQMV